MYWDLTEFAVTGTSIFQKWPPDYLLRVYQPVPGVDTFLTLPAPITLPVGYGGFLPFDPIQWLNLFINYTNVAWQNYTNVVDPSLLIASDFYTPGYVYSAYFGPPVLP